MVCNGHSTWLAMVRLEQFYRLIFTGLSFIFFGLGGLLLTLTAFPLINIFIRDKDRRANAAQWLVHQAFRSHILFMTFFKVISVEIIGAEKLASDRGTLIISNHPSLIDVVLLTSLMRQTQCIIKADIWRNPFMRGVVTAAGYIKNDDHPEKLLADCAAVLRDGHNLIIFPEGSRSVPGRAMKLHRGVANIAIMAAAPIRLIRIDCVPPSLMKGQKWWQIPQVRSHFTVTVGGLIEITNFIKDAERPIAARRLTEHLGNLLTGA